MLWQFTARFAPQGDIGKHTDKAIAAAVGWKRPTGARGVTPECRLSDALVDAGWLDRCEVLRLIVHDWKDHCDQSVARYLSRHKLDFVQPKLASHSHSQGHSSVKPLPVTPADKPAGSEPEDTQTPPVIAIIPAAVSDAAFHSTIGSFLSLGVAISETDMRRCAILWVSLDSVGKREASTYAGIQAEGEWRRREEKFVPRPWNYLSERQWERKSVAPARQRPMSKAEVAHTAGAAIFLKSKGGVV
jgi:hypothetical protein